MPDRFRGQRVDLSVTATIDGLALLLGQNLMLFNMNALTDVLKNVDNVLGLVQMFHTV